MMFTHLFYGTIAFNFALVLLLYFRPQIRRWNELRKFKKAYARMWKEQGGAPQRKTPHDCLSYYHFIKWTAPDGSIHWRCNGCQGTFTEGEFNALNLVQGRGRA